jgi:hypothetical protein
VGRRGTYLGGSSLDGAIGPKKRKERAQYLTGRIWRHLEEHKKPAVAHESQPSFEARHSADWPIVKRGK